MQAARSDWFAQPSPDARDPLSQLYRARMASTPLILAMSGVAASGAAVWLGAGFAVRWLIAAALLIGMDRCVCWRLCRRPPGDPTRRRIVEAVVAVDTLIYVFGYCTLPLGLVIRGGHLPTIAGMAMIGAIAVSGTAEFVISRLIGSAALLGLVAASAIAVLWGVAGRDWLGAGLALFSVAAFFRYVLDQGVSADGVERRMAAALAVARAKEAEAGAANAAKSTFLAVMSHEIRTPLNGVLGMAQAMEADGLSEAQRRRLAVIRGSGEALLVVLNDILDLSKIEAGKLELERIDFDLDAVLAGVEAAFAPQAAAKRLAYRTLVAPEAHGAYAGDPTRLRQILSNLVANAVKFTDTGEVTVSVDRQGDLLRLVVADTGAGIPAGKMDALFARFSQVDASTTRRHGGTGLGLAICRELCALMGGRIEVESAEGEGSRFTVALPLERRAEPARAAAPRAAFGPAPAPDDIRVLAVEDNAVNQLVLKTLLAHIGIEPIMVENGLEAVTAWEDGDWSLILMDVQMPVMDGVTATREIRRREAALGRPRTPIIALTANAMAHQIAEYAAAGMDDHVAKPIEAAGLFAAVEAALNRSDAARASAA